MWIQVSAKNSGTQKYFSAFESTTSFDRIEFLYAKSLHPLKKVQNAAARVITGARMRDLMTPHLRDLHWLPVPYRIDFKIAVITYRCVNGCAPSYLSNLIRLTTSVSHNGRSLRSLSSPSAPYDLVPQSARVKTYGSRAFSNYAPTVWNKLPLSVRSSPTLSSFRSSLKCHFFREAFSTPVPRINWELHKSAFDDFVLSVKVRYTNRIHYYYY